MPAGKLKSLLKGQIEEGKKLLQIPVPQIHSGGFTGYGFGGYAAQTRNTKKHNTMLSKQRFINGVTLQERSSNRLLTYQTTNTIQVL